MHPQLRRTLRSALPVAATLASLAFAVGCSSSRSATTRAAEAPAAPTPSQRHAAEEVSRHFTDGSLYEMRERHAEAIAEYRRALEYDTTIGAVYYAMGKSFRELNELDSAIAYSRRAIERTPTLDAHEQLADLLMLAGDVDSAIVEYEAMLTVEPDHLQSRYLLARLLQRRDPTRARAHYEYILRNLTDDTDVMLRLAELYLDAGQVDSAIGMMQRMLVAEPASADLHQMVTNLLLDAGRYGAALGVLRSADTSIAIGSPLESFYAESLRDVRDRMREQRASGADARGDTHESSAGDSLAAYARELVIRASAQATSLRVRLVGGIVAMELGDPARAEALFARALDDSLASAETWTQIAKTYDADPATGPRVLAPSLGRFADDFRIPYFMGLLNDRAGHPDSAIAWLRRSIALYDENAEAWGALARLYERSGRVGASDAAFEKSIDLDGGDASILNDFAHALALRGSRLDRALELANQALAIEPENESYLDTKGLILFKRGELDAALEFLGRAIGAGGASAEIYEHMGDLRKARGELKEAREAYRRAAELEPQPAGIRERQRSVR